MQESALIDQPVPTRQDALQPDAVVDLSVTKLTFITPVLDITEPGILLPLNVASRLVEVQVAVVHEYT